MLSGSRLAGNRYLVRIWRAVHQQHCQQPHCVGTGGMQAAQPLAMHRSSSTMPCLHQQACRLPTPAAYHQQHLLASCRRPHACPAAATGASRPGRHYTLLANATHIPSSSSSSSIWRASKPFSPGPIVLSSSSSGAMHRQHSSSRAAAAATDTAPSSAAAAPAAAAAAGTAAASPEELAALRSKLQLFNTMSRQKEVGDG